MFGNRPHADELLAALRESLVDLAPRLEGAQNFELRVAVKALDILARELAQGPAAAAHERERLGAFFGSDGSLPALHQELCARLRDRRLRHDDPVVLALLRAGVQARLAIDHPSLLRPPA